MRTRLHDILERAKDLRSHVTDTPHWSAQKERTGHHRKPPPMNSSSQDSPPLVPLAQPVYLDARGKPAEAPPGHYDSHRETKWHNPTTKVVVINLFIGTPQAMGPLFPPRNWEERTGQRRFVWQPGETKALPHEYDKGIQQTHCKENECLQRPLACTDPEHEHEVIGGYGPQLVNLGMQKRPHLAPALDDELTRRTEAERKEFENYKLAKFHEEQGMRARAEADAAQRDIDLRAKLDADAAVLAAKHQPQPPKNK
jgi:hypothetical protein